MYVIELPDGFYRAGAPAPVLHMGDATAYPTEADALRAILDRLCGMEARVVDVAAVRWAPATAD